MVRGARLVYWDRIAACRHREQPAALLKPASKQHSPFAPAPTAPAAPSAPRSLHTKSTKALRAMMTKLQVPEAVRAAAAAGGSAPAPPAKGSSSGGGGGGGASGSAPGGEGNAAAAGVMLELLECTLWQRQLGSLSEEMVAALVCQVGGGAAGAHARRHARSLGARPSVQAQLPGRRPWRTRAAAPRCMQAPTPHRRRLSCRAPLSVPAPMATKHPQVFEGIRDYLIQSAELKFK